jgi:hypothetical protein
VSGPGVDLNAERFARPNANEWGARTCPVARARSKVDNRDVADRIVSSFVPQLSIEAACARRGRQAVIDRCGGLVTEGETRSDYESDDELIEALGGPRARAVLDAGPRPDQRYWIRVWAMRGLLWAWEDSAFGAVLAGLADPAWRVREMSAKVVARHRLGEALATVAELRDDAVPRVRAAATRAVAVLTASGA